MLGGKEEEAEEATVEVWLGFEVGQGGWGFVDTFIFLVWCVRRERRRGVAGK